MCGIIGYTGSSPALPIIIEGLKRMEYRGYDSAGVALIENGKLELRRNTGKIVDLIKKLHNETFNASTGLGHTRWATHGRPSEENAHPHTSAKSKFVVVHNGIIENYLTLKKDLIAKGYIFKSDTDTEVVAHLLEENYNGNLLETVQKTVKMLKGAYALGILHVDDPGIVIGTCDSSPLVVGKNGNGAFLASDITALLDHTRDFFILEHGDICILEESKLTIYNAKGEPAQKKPVHIDWNPVMAQKQGYKHYMLKEIFEQPRAISETLMSRINWEEGTIYLDELKGVDDNFMRNISRIYLVACGTAWHACLVGRYMIERRSPFTVEVDYSHEFRYRDPKVDDKTLIVCVSQSGETADTIAALEEGRKHGARILSICNVLGSTVARNSDGVLYTHAGPEIGVASTKAFTTQLVSLFMLAIYLGRLTDTIDKAKGVKLLNDLVAIPDLVEKTLDIDTHLKKLAGRFIYKQDFLFLARGINYPIALEGALKLKEISYIHAEGYPAGEMKHGPIALIDQDMPVVILAPKNHLLDKTLSNLEEVKARGGETIVFCQDISEVDKYSVDHIFELPETIHDLTPVIMTIPMQLLAYHIADQRGADVDQPRNLAKSVTVE
jgi:glucosamine--fructose-6-phosphate aminotransferase (isomerizing)